MDYSSVQQHAAGLPTSYMAMTPYSTSGYYVPAPLQLGWRAPCVAAPWPAMMHPGYSMPLMGAAYVVQGYQPRLAMNHPAAYGCTAGPMALQTAVMVPSAYPHQQWTASVPVPPLPPVPPPQPQPVPPPPPKTEKAHAKGNAVPPTVKVATAKTQKPQQKHEEQLTAQQAPALLQQPMPEQLEGPRTPSQQELPTSSGSEQPPTVPCHDAATPSADSAAAVPAAGPAPAPAEAEAAASGAPLLSQPGTAALTKLTPWLFVKGSQGCTPPAAQEAAVQPGTGKPAGQQPVNTCSSRSPGAAAQQDAPANRVPVTACSRNGCGSVAHHGRMATGGGGGAAGPGAAVNTALTSKSDSGRIGGNQTRASKSTAAAAAAAQATPAATSAAAVELQSTLPLAGPRRQPKSTLRAALLQAIRLQPPPPDAAEAKRMQAAFQYALFADHAAYVMGLLQPCAAGKLGCLMRLAAHDLQAILAQPQPLELLDALWEQHRQQG